MDDPSERLNADVKLRVPPSLRRLMALAPYIVKDPLYMQRRCRLSTILRIALLLGLKALEKRYEIN